MERWRTEPTVDVARSPRGPRLSSLSQVTVIENDSEQSSQLLCCHMTASVVFKETSKNVPCHFDRVLRGRQHTVLFQVFTCRWK